MVKTVLELLLRDFCFCSTNIFGMHPCSKKRNLSGFNFTLDDMKKDVS